MRVIFSLIGVLISGAALAIGAGQVDDFEDGTVQGWSEGGPSPNPPVNIATGGPDGADDNYLRNAASGGGGSSGNTSLAARI